VLLGCYLSWTGFAANPQEGMLTVCSMLGISEELIWPSHRRYAKYFALLQRSVIPTAGRPALTLRRVVLVGVGGDGVRRVLEVWQQDRLLFRAGVDTEELEGAVLHVGVQCCGDVSLRVLRTAVCAGGAAGQATGEQQTELELQACFHTAFVADGFVRFLGHELDAPEGAAPASAAIDAFLESGGGTEPEEQREAAAAATAAAAAAEGPGFPPGHPTGSGHFASEAQLRDDPGSPAAVPLDAKPGKVVFLPEDIDAFFDDL